MKYIINNKVQGGNNGNMQSGFLLNLIDSVN